MGRSGINRERVPCHIVLDLGAEHLLQSPYTRVVIGGIEFYVADIRLVEIKLPLGGIIEIVGRGKLDQILRSQEIGCVLRVIVAEPTLISRHKVFVFGYATG